MPSRRLSPWANQVLSAQYRRYRLLGGSGSAAILHRFAAPVGWVGAINTLVCDILPQQLTRSEPLRRQRAGKAVNQGLAIEGLVQKASGAAFQGARFQFLLGKGGDKDDRDAETPFAQS